MEYEQLPSNTLKHSELANVWTIIGNWLKLLSWVVIVIVKRFALKLNKTLKPFWAESIPLIPQWSKCEWTDCWQGGRGEEGKWKGGNLTGKLNLRLDEKVKKEKENTRNQCIFMGMFYTTLDCKYLYMSFHLFSSIFENFAIPQFMGPRGSPHNSFGPKLA